MNDPPMFPELFEAVPDALILVDDAGRITHANAQAERLFGYSPQTVVGLAIEALMPATVHARHRLHRAGYIANPRVRSMGESDQSLIGQRLDGQQFPVEIALSPISSEQGPRYLASIRDISESLRARQALVRARYDALVGHIGQLALESVDGGVVIESLPALLAEALGVEVVVVAFRRQDSDGIEIRASFGVSGDWLELLSSLDKQDGALWQMLASGLPIVVPDSDRHATGLLSLADGISASSVVVPLLDRDRPMGALIALSRQPRRFEHDAMHLLQSVANLLAALMQRRRTEEQLAHSQRLEAIGQLTGGVAHDFNNLLTIISGNLQLLEAQRGERTGSAELIASALQAASRGAELTNKLLAFARRQRLVPRAILPQTHLREIAELMRRTLGESIRLKVEYPDAITAAYADATQLDSALINLALNARDAMPRGGEITLAASERWVSATDGDLDAGHYVVFSVTDTGHGMTPETLSHAIEPFFTTKGVGRGSGLGLSMVYGFVKQSGGSLHLDSQLGYGTRIELSLPVAQAIAEAAVPTAHVSTQGEGETVLVVEDEEDVRGIAVAFLRSFGYQVRAAGGAAEALQRLADDPDIALLFTDVRLGDGMDGNELALAARALRPGLAVLLTSGYHDTAASSRLDAPGSFELLRKPYRREQLAAAIRRNLSPAA